VDRERPPQARLVAVIRREAFLRAVPARLATAVAFLLLVAPAVAQAADDSSTKNYRTRVDRVSPAVTGLKVTTEGGDRYLVVKNDTGKTVMFPGYDGEQYLRFLPSGEVDANANSPAKYLNEIRFGTPGSVTIPISALKGGKPKWVRVASGGSYKWFDHRIHWMEKQPPSVVKDKSKQTKIFDWKVPARVGATPVPVAGTLSWVPASSSSSGLSGGAIAAIVAIATAVLALILVLLRRRGGPATAEPREEKPVKEAW
jgi:hypothetical protein